MKLDVNKEEAEMLKQALKLFIDTIGSSHAGPTEDAESMAADMRLKLDALIGTREPYSARMKRGASAAT